VFQQRDADHYDELGRIKTVSGARTASSRRSSTSCILP
jgi:hypothetical protein